MSYPGHPDWQYYGPQAPQNGPPYQPSAGFMGPQQYPVPFFPILPPLYPPITTYYHLQNYHDPRLYAPLYPFNHPQQQRHPASVPLPYQPSLDSYYMSAPVRPYLYHQQEMRQEENSARMDGEQWQQQIPPDPLKVVVKSASAKEPANEASLINHNKAELPPSGKDLPPSAYRCPSNSMVRTLDSHVNSATDDLMGQLKRFENVVDNELCRQIPAQKNEDDYQDLTERNASHVELQELHQFKVPDRFYAREPNLAAIRHYLSAFRRNHQQHLTKTEKDVIARQSKRFRLSSSNSLEYRCANQPWRIYPETEDMRQNILTETHKIWGHIRRDLMLQKIKENYCWYTLREDIEKFVNTCETCQRNGKGLLKVTETLQQIKIVSKAWYLLGMDLIGPLKLTPRGNRYILTVVDYFTKWVEAVAMPRRDAVTVAKALHENVYCRNGAPHRIITDNGREFSNQLNKILNEVYGIKHSFTRPYTPNANGMVERFNGTIQRLLRLKVSETGDDWDEHLNHALFDVRIRPHTATKFSPFDLFHSWRFRFNPNDSETQEENELLEVLQSGNEVQEEQMQKNCEEMMARFDTAKDLILEEAAANIQKEQLRQKTAFNRKKMGHGVEIKRGDKVYFRSKQRGSLRGKASAPLKMGNITKVFSRSVQVQHGTQKLTVRRDDVRVPKLPGHREHSNSEASTSPVLCRRKRLWECASDTSSPNLQQREQLEEEEETSRIENGTVANATRKYTKPARKFPKPAVMIDITGDTAVTKMPHPQMDQKIEKVPETVSRAENTELPDVEILDYQQKENRVTDGGTIPDSELATEEARQERIRNIEASIAVLDQLFWKGVDDIKDAWLTLKKERSPRFPSMPGVLKPDHVRLEISRRDPEVKAEIYQSIMWLHADVLRCISCDAWTKLARSLDHTKFEENRITTNVFWLSSGSIDLSLADQVRTQSEKEWISDEIINATQSLLRKQFPTIAGFRDSLQFSIVGSGTNDLKRIYTSIDRIRDDSIVSNDSFKRHLIQAGHRQIQILFVNGNHWITASNLRSGSLEDVFIYDSLPPHYEEYVNHQVASVFRQSSAQINLIWPPMCKQPNGNDCGAYAIASAVALAFGEAPEAQNWNSSLMRNHLVKCLTKQEFELFPTLRATRACGKTSKTIKRNVIKIHCKCRTPSLIHEATVTCVNNGKGCPIGVYHESCTVGRKTGLDHNLRRKYICPSCLDN